MPESSEKGLARRAVPWIVLVLAIGFSAIIRWRLRDVPLERDEGEFGYAGQLLLKGFPPFEGAYNQKFPGVSAAYAIIMAVFGQTASGIHLGVCLVNALTIVLLFLLARRLWDSLAGAAAAITYTLLSMDHASQGMAAHATHFVVLFAVLGLILLLAGLDRRRSWMLFLSGISLGIATLMKQPGAFFLLFAVCWVVVHQLLNPPVRWRSVIANSTLICAGAAAPLLITGLWLWHAGTFGRFWFWTIVFAGKYGSQISFGEAPEALASGFATVAQDTYVLWLLAATGALLAWLNPAARSQRWFVTMLLLASLLATSAGFFYRGHYFILCMPAAALLVGGGIVEARRRLAPRFGARDWLLPAAALALGCAWTIWQERAYFFLMTPEQFCRVNYPGNPFVESRAIAKYLADHTAPDEKIAVLGSEAQIYFYAKRPSATGYIFTYGLMQVHPYALQMQHEMAAEIEKAQPRYIVFVKIPTSWLLDEQSTTWIFNWFAEYQKHYEVVGIIQTSEEGSTYRWDEQARGVAMPRGFYVAVLRRKTSD